MQLAVRTRKTARHAAAIAAVLLASISAAWAGMSCPTDPPMPGLRLPHLRAALTGETEAVIVALGSSSTQGAMASDPAHTYPAELQAALNKALPGTHIAVINRGIGGQDAPEELARLDDDAIAVRPQLVIWQVGANGAMRHANPVEFKRLVEQGVVRLQGTGIDVILMDNQHSPKLLAAVEHIVLERELREVAQETGVNLFSRSRLMDAWSEDGDKPGMFTAPDGLHHNDLGYWCVTQALSHEIAEAVGAPVSASTRR